MWNVRSPTSSLLFITFLPFYSFSRTHECEKWKFVCGKEQPLGGWGGHLKSASLSGALCALSTSNTTSMLGQSKTWRRLSCTSSLTYPKLSMSDRTYTSISCPFFRMKFVHVYHWFDSILIYDLYIRPVHATYMFDPYIQPVFDRFISLLFYFFIWRGIFRFMVDHVPSYGFVIGWKTFPYMMEHVSLYGRACFVIWWCIFVT